jgi:hypothetical protein
MSDFAPLIRFISHLPKNGDPELSLLKCHLLVEEVLSEIIRTGVRRPDQVKQARLSFKQKLALARAVTVAHGEEWMWTSARKLNEARNELAHGLETNQINEKVEEYIQFVEGKCGQPALDAIGGPLQRLQWSAFHTFASLSAIAQLDISVINRSAFKILTENTAGPSTGGSDIKTATSRDNPTP